MSKRFPRFFTYIKEWLIPDVTRPSSHRFTSGRGNNNKASQLRDVDAKVIHQYPNQTKFPFPAVRDDEQLGYSFPHLEKEKKKLANVSPIPNRKSQRKREIKATGERENKPIDRKKETLKDSGEFFQGKGFTFQKSPSPIYGHRVQPRRVKSEINVYQNQERKIETTSSELSLHEVVAKEEPTKSIVSSQQETEDTNKMTDVQTELHSVVPESDMVNQSPRKITKNVVKQNQKNIPYNVLMFQRDRIKEKGKPIHKDNTYSFPALHLLDIPPREEGINNEWITYQKNKLDETFQYFNIGAKVVHVTEGPTVTRFEIHPEPGVKVSKITNLTDDIKLSLAAKDIRMEAPIPGKNMIGIEVPNRVPKTVFLRQILEHSSFQRAESPLTVGLGMDISGTPIVTDLQKMPHGLIAGSTGSGKSVCVNSILLSLLFKSSPKDVRLLLIDPKVVELAPYNAVPHLAYPVITDPKEATEGLKWAVSEMEKRYELFAKYGSRDLRRYNQKMKLDGKEEDVLPYIVIIVDELADLMMVSPQDVEESICRIAQKARACGIHLLVATQRPSVDVITGLIKANIPTRIAFSVSAQADSRTILDGSGAERLLGKGDMLFLENGSGKPVRIQGTFVSDEEIERVMTKISQNEKPPYMFEKEMLKQQPLDGMIEDDLFESACLFVCEQQAASASLLQRQFRIGYNRAARIIDEMEDKGIISAARGSKSREVYLTNEEINEKMEMKGEF
ncbi:DNA translocase FtsK [Evansella tamaricis]|uniref:DNA translocase FtsK n=1 Tax=Evansella tamaricis TaxID=2069301 RepID=A0ABS6JJ85_9BACI|nr:DNA translocase FtsK [Evansella tamaricis]MBU9713725.1 DNA translocase FtsK [Evansella tamaricis]